MELVSSLLRQSPATQRVVAAKFPTFNVLVEQEAALVDAARKSDLTLLIEDADHRVDRDITGIRGAVASAVHHYDPTTVAAAVSLQNRLKAFGDIAKKPTPRRSPRSTSSSPTCTTPTPRRQPCSASAGG
jgi:hypothetical protein